MSELRSSKFIDPPSSIRRPFLRMPAPKAFIHPRGAPEKLPCLSQLSDEEALSDNPKDEGNLLPAEGYPPSKQTTFRAIAWMYNGESSIFGVRMQESDANVRTVHLNHKIMCVFHMCFLFRTCPTQFLFLWLVSPLGYP